MLKQLYIKNFTLIDELNIPFFPGFSVITGETGAGKSIILGAISLLLGNRADCKQIKIGQDRCVIEAHFDLSRYNIQSFFDDNDIDYDAEDCIIRREITSNGKSRAFINDTPVPLSLMKEIGEQLMDIHSQHQNLLLNKEDFQLNVVDTLADDNLQLKDYQRSYTEYNNALKELEKLKEDIFKSRENEEFMRFQLKELEDAHLIADEQEALEAEAETLSHAEDIKQSIYESDNILNGDDNGIVNKIKSVVSSLRNIENVYPRISDMVSRFESCHVELKDLSQEISSMSNDIEFDPQRLAFINERLDIIYSLEHKFHAETITELIVIQQDLSKKLNTIDNSDEKMKELEAIVNRLYDTCIKKSEQLNSIRNKSAKVIENEMLQHLIPLGIPNAQFKIQFTPKPLSKDGTDKISFLFSANKNSTLQPVSSVASGGEISRVMLSIKTMISGAVKLPTIIFDEIDTGVSGRIAEQMAKIMCLMGNNNRQVISITHLPQIAAMGTTHYRVSKEDTNNGTISHMYILDNKERINEIAKMLSGTDVTEAAINNAKSLLSIK